MPEPIADLDDAATDAVELLAQLDGPVSACPRCGYLGVRAPGVRDGLWPGGGETGARFVCPRCQYQGIPIEFDNGDDYAQWVRELHGEAPA
jgi:hypothetical protein